MALKSRWQETSLNDRLVDHARRGLSPAEGAAELGVSLSQYRRYLESRGGKIVTSRTITLPDRSEELNDAEIDSPAAVAR